MTGYLKYGRSAVFLQFNVWTRQVANHVSDHSFRLDCQLVLALRKKIMSGIPITELK